MADTETFLFETENGRKMYYFEDGGPSSYSTNGFTVTITNLRAVEKVVNLENDAGFRTSAAEANDNISNNTFKVPVHYYGYGCPGPIDVCSSGWEVPSGRDISMNVFSGLVIGY